MYESLILNIGGKLDDTLVHEIMLDETKFDVDQNEM